MEICNKNNTFYDTILYLSEQFLDLNWMIINGASLPFYKISSKVNDIDIITDRQSAKIISKILKKHCIKEIEYSSDGLFKSYYGIFEINGFKVEIISQMEVFIEGVWHSNLYELSQKIEFKLRDKLIPVVPLSTLLKWYDRVRREKDIQKIDIIKSSFFCDIQAPAQMI